MANFILTFISTFIPGLLSVSLFRGISYSVDRHYLKDDQIRSLYKQKFDLYRQLYLKIVETPLGEPINNERALDFIEKFLIDLSNSDTLFLLISENLLNWFRLFSYDKNNNTLSYIKKNVKDDFNQIKYKLGYLDKLNIENKIYIVIVSISSLILAAMVTIIEQSLNLKEYNKNILLIMYWITAVLVFLGVCYLMNKTSYLKLSFKKKYKTIKKI